MTHIDIPADVLEALLSGSNDPTHDPVADREQMPDHVAMQRQGDDHPAGVRQVSSTEFEVTE